MNLKVRFFRETIILTILLFLSVDFSWAQSGSMLSPVLQIDRKDFSGNLQKIILQPFIDPAASLADKMIQARQVYARMDAGKKTSSAWPKFFLNTVLNPATDKLRAQMQELILFMDSDIFNDMTALDKLEHIEYLAKELSPFEKILFYEGVYFTESDSRELGFNINKKQDWGVLYFYGTRLFAHGALHDYKDSIDLTFGDDLRIRDLPDIEQVHFYVYMKRLADAYTRYPGKRFNIGNDQLISLATHTEKTFLGRTLNFYLLKVGGFVPEYKPLPGLDQINYDEYLSQLKIGLHLTFRDCLKIVDMFGLARDIGQEEKEYLSNLRQQSNKNRAISKRRIKARDILLLPKQDVRKIWGEKYPVEVRDKIVLDNLGYCAGAVFSNGKKIWFRRYGENPYIMEALDKDLKAKNAAEIFTVNTKVVLMSTSYGSWRYDLDDVKSRLIAQGLREENIIILPSDANPSLDGIGIYLFPDKTVVIYNKNHSSGVFESVQISHNLSNLQNPDIISRFDIEDMLMKKAEQSI